MVADCTRPCYNHHHQYRGLHMPRLLPPPQEIVGARHCCHHHEGQQVTGTVVTTARDSRCQALLLVIQDRDIICHAMLTPWGKSRCQALLPLQGKSCTYLEWKVEGEWNAVLARADLIHIPHQQQIKKHVDCQHQQNHGGCEVVARVACLPQVVPLDANC